MVNPFQPTAGISLKPCHFAEIHAAPGRASWFEVHAENYFMRGGPPHRHLTAIRQDHPLSIHGVGLSLAGVRRPDAEHLARLRELVRRYQPDLVSEHLAWCENDGVYLNDLLPIPYDEAALTRVAAHIAETQDALGRAILIENPSRYVPFRATMAEGPFIAELCHRTGCGLLLDVNNVYVAARNMGESPDEMLRAMPMQYAAQIHLAGHSIAESPAGTFHIDDHGSAVCDEVWSLYDLVLARTGALPTLIEWDTDIPAFDRLLTEAARAQIHLNHCPGERIHAA